MDTFAENVSKELTKEELTEISAEAIARLEQLAGNLKAKAENMDEKELYHTMTDYAEKEIKAYFADPDNMKKVLSNPHNIGEAYQKMTETDEFKKIGTQEHRMLPRVVMMMMLAGAEAHAADAAALYLQNQKKAPAEEIAPYVHLIDIYNGYFKDAVNYGHGNDKNVVFSGEKQ